MSPSTNQPSVVEQAPRVADTLVVTPAAQEPPQRPRRTPGRVAVGVVRGMRPKQWIKSVLVPAAPAAAGVLFHSLILERTIVAVVAFTLASGGTYLINDASDVAADRRHPRKRHRPVASGLVPVPLAYGLGVLFMLGAAVGGGLLATWELGAVLGTYVLMQLLYSRWLKHVAVVELVVVALGFLLRAIAGAAACRVPLSQWFLIVASFGSLFMVVGKRYAEVTALGDSAASARRILAEYPPAYLRQVRDVCVAVTLLAYCLWAFERAGPGGRAGTSLATVGSAGSAGDPLLPWYQLSILPVTLGLLRYALLLERGEGGAPEEVVLRDRPLQLAGLGWLLLFGLGVGHV